MTSKGTIVLAAGGTGGHLFPAQALAEELTRRGYTIHLMTDERVRDYGKSFPATEIHVVPSATLSLSKPWLVPSRALKELERLLGDAEEITLRLGEREATFEVGGIRLTTRLIEGEFPNYRGLIPASHPNRLTVGRDALAEAVRRVKLMAREPNTPVRLAMSADGLELVAITQDVGQAHEQLDATYQGEDLTVAFNPDYLLSGVDVTPGDEITLDTVDAQKPAVIRSAGAQEFLYLLMPVRVS